MNRLIVSVVAALWAAFLLPSGNAMAREFDLKFEPGKSYGVASTAVIRGDRDNYYFGANEGQVVSVAVTSVEDNAVVELAYKLGPNWVLFDEFGEARVWYGRLPASDSGQYRVTVGGTRGNATYDLFVGISSI